jgi:hypothetical protein
VALIALVMRPWLIYLPHCFHFLGCVVSSWWWNNGESGLGRQSSREESLFSSESLSY